MLPPLMPYTTEKSPIFQVLESFFNDNRERALRCLWRLLDGDKLSEMPPVWSTSLDVPPYDTQQKRARHVNEHWWGFQETPPGSGNWEPPQEAFDEATNPTTGFWEQWHGKAEDVFRETLIRALSVSLGIVREAPADTEQFKGNDRPPAMHGSRHWPISILWKCPSPWYEGWIEFKQWGPGAREGHVTLLLSTPAHGVQLYNTPILPQNKQSDSPYNAYMLDPRAPAGPNGLWLVSQVYHRKWSRSAPGQSPGTNPSSGSGQWRVPDPGATYVESQGEPICLSTRVRDGGVAPGGIPYLAP